MSATTTGETGQAPAATAGQAPIVTTGTTATATGTTADAEAGKTYTEAQMKVVRDEAAKHRVELKALKDAEDARQTAALSETERLKKEATDASARATAAETRAREALGRAAVTAAAAKVGVDAAIAQRLVTVEYDAEGEPKDVDAALAKLVKDHPYLVVGNAAAATTSAANPPRGGVTLTDPKALPRLGMTGLFKTG